VFLSLRSVNRLSSHLPQIGLDLCGKESSPVIWIAVVSFAIATGAVVTFRPLRDSVLLVATVVCLLLFTLKRRTATPQHVVGLIQASQFRQGDGSSSATLDPNQRKSEYQRDDFRFARFFYYLGLIFIAQLTLRPFLSVTLSDWFFFVSLLAMFFEVLTHRRHLIFLIPHSLLCGITCFMLGALISSFVSELPFESIAVAIRFVYVTLVWFWLGTMLLQKTSHVQTAVVLWVASVAATGAAAVAQLFWGDIVPGTAITWGRMTGFTQHVNDLGGSTCVALIPALVVVLWMTKTVPMSMVAYIPLLLVTAGLVLSGSVGGFIAAVSGILLWFGLGRLNFRLLLMFLVAGIGLFSLVETQRSVGAPLLLERIATVIEPSDSRATLWSRVGTYEAAWREIEINPLVGVGLSLGGTETVTGDAVHNVLLGVWFEAGLFGILGMLIILLSVFTLGRRTIMGASSQEERLVALCLVASFSAFVVYAMGAPVLYQRYGWVSAALLMALRRRQEIRQKLSMIRAGVVSMPRF
jgi:O-antigen ligase